MIELILLTYRDLGKILPIIMDWLRQVWCIDLFICQPVPVETTIYEPGMALDFANSVPA